MGHRYFSWTCSRVRYLKRNVPNVIKYKKYATQRVLTLYRRLPFFNEQKCNPHLVEFHVTYLHLLNG